MNTGKEKDSKPGIFNSLKKKFLSGSVRSKSYVIDKGSKLKFKSKSSHCNLTSVSEDFNGLFTETSTLSVSEELSRVHSLCDPTVSTSESQHVYSNLGALNINVRDVGIQTESNGQSTLSSFRPFAESVERSNSRSFVSSQEPLYCNIPIRQQSLSPMRSSFTQPRENIYANINQYEELSSSNLKSGLTSELLKLSKYGWYWGSISKDEAEEKLTDQPDGAFLLRDSTADHFLLTLSFRSSGKTLHTRIEYNLGRGLFSFYQQSDEYFASISDLIEHSMHFSKSAVYCYSRPTSPVHPAFPVRLTKPVSRFAHVRSLQHLCRFVIRESVRLDNIKNLPLPNSIKGYIEEGRY